MKKKYNIFIVSRMYLKDYYKFLLNETSISKSSEAFELFMYSMKKLYGLEAIEYNRAIDRYGSECVEYLRKTPNTPKNINKVSFEDRVRIVSVCEGYAQATNILTHKYISNNRLKEG